MPYKSEAQRRFFHAAEKRGEIKASTVKEWDRESKGKKMPARVGGKYQRDDEIPKIDKGAFAKYMQKRGKPSSGEGGHKEPDGDEGTCPQCGAKMSCPKCG